MPSKHQNANRLIAQGIFDSVRSFNELEQRISALYFTNTKAQGDAFEIFVEAYLATHPIVQCEETWLVGDIPIDVREALNLPNDSKGIDGVYKSILGHFIPYQVKFRSNRPHLGFNEIAPFLGITEKATDRLLITNSDSISIDVQNRTGIRSLRGVDFDQLTAEDFTAIENWLKQKPQERIPLTPDPYQVEALNNIANHLQNNDRGTVVMACGTGKTLIALWTVEQSKAKSILVLVPSLTLLQQTLEEWSVRNSWGKDFSYLCVCSDPSVNLRNDEIEIDPVDVPFRIDTDPDIVSHYLAQKNKKIKIVFSTYQSSQVVSEATNGNFEFDIAVFDEAHKTTGAAEGRFALALKDENIKIRKRLFLTATPKHYDISKRDKDGEFKYVSMDNEGVYGKRAHTLTFGAAASQGIICPYRVVITLIDKQQVDDFALKNGITLIEGDTVNAKWVANRIAVRSAIEHTNAKKIITFHSRVKTAREFANDEIFGIKHFIDEFEVFHVHGKQKSNERKATISKFRNASRSIITNARCLTEGVDVPAVDMVVFVDPRHSKIDIAQAVGRAMRKPRGGDKKIGYIVVPIYSENSSREALEKAITSENFEDVIIVLNALLEQDNEFTELITNMSISLGRTVRPTISDYGNRIEILSPIISQSVLEESISLYILKRLGSSWSEWYGRLKAYERRYGNVRVKQNYISGNGFKLGNWVQQQRRNKKTLSENQKNLLEGLIGWTWDVNETKWFESYLILKNFAIDNNTCRLPNGWIDPKSKFKLYAWVVKQRSSKEDLNQDQIQLLESLPDWTWDSRHAKWSIGFNFLKAYTFEYGHSIVPASYVNQESYKLGSWVARQRSRKKLLDSEQISLLSELPKWTWNSKNS